MNALINQIPLFLRTKNVVISIFSPICLILILILNGCENEDIIPQSNRNIQQRHNSVNMTDFYNPLPVADRAYGDGISTNNVELEGDFTSQTNPDGGFTLTGTGLVFIETECRTLSLEVEDANLNFTPDSIFRGIVGGLIDPPKPNDECFLIGAPEGGKPLLRSDLFFFKGDYINDTYDLAIELDSTKTYFLMGIRADVNLGLCDEDGNGVNENWTFDVNIGQFVYVFDFCDPLYYHHKSSGLVGIGSAHGRSYKGNIPFKADYPVTGEIENFYGKSIVYGMYSLQDPSRKFLSMGLEGTVVYGTEFDTRLQPENFFKSDFDASFQAGFNGAGSIDIGPLSIPFADGSIGFSTNIGTSGAGLRGYVRSETDHFSSWWPTFLPFSPISTGEIVGYFDTDVERFELDMGSKLGIQLPSGPSIVSGEHSMETILSMNNDEISFTRAVTLNDRTYDVRGAIREGESELSVGLPSIFINNLRTSIIDRLDLRLDEIDSLEIDYQSAFEAYELALGLQGLREQIPVITASARRAIDEGEAKAKSKAAQRIPRNVCTSCSAGDLRKNINNWIRGRANIYRNLVNNLEAAVADSLDDATARVKLEQALRELVANKKLTSKKAFPFCWKVKVGFVQKCIRAPRTITINLSDYNIYILNSGEVNTLSQAITYIPLIPTANERYLDAKTIFEGLEPEKDRISNLRSGFAQGTQPLPEIGRIGFLKSHDSLGGYSFFYDKADETRINIDREFDPFSPENFLDAFYRL